MMQTMYFTLNVAATAAATAGFATHDDYHFDGITLRPLGRTFQLCDVTDPQLKRYIDETVLRDECDAKYGWWPEDRYEVIRAVMKSKLRKLVQGEVPRITDYVDYLSGAPLSKGSDGQLTAGARRLDDGENDDDAVMQDAVDANDDDDNDNDDNDDDEGGADLREPVIDPQLEQEVDQRVEAITRTL